MSGINADLYKQIEKLAISMDYELWGCELIPQTSNLIFRIYIDRPQGVTVEDCSKISRQVSALLDVEDPIHSSYILEVSSPGIDRPLFKLDHYHKYMGKLLKIKLHTPVDNKRKFTGVLKRIEDKSICFLVEGNDQEIKVSFDMIEKANLMRSL